MVTRNRANVFPILTSFFLIAPNFLLVLTLILSPTVSAQSTGSCNVPAVNDPSNGNRISVEPVEDSWWDNVEDPRFDLDTDLFTDFTVDNDTATAIGMRLVPGYMYTFCISIASNQDDPPLNPNSDIYLMTEPNWDRYKMYYGMRDDPYFFDAFDRFLLNGGTWMIGFPLGTFMHMKELPIKSSRLPLTPAVLDSLAVVTYCITS